MVIALILVSIGIISIAKMYSAIRKDEKRNNK